MIRYLHVLVGVIGFSSVVTGNPGIETLQFYEALNKGDEALVRS